ncbi:hypothetical protein Bbelb_340530 [Branchiostoma belcheri]|nr:hypothetical protein Bbelb_340530 [Branchiostoma belcheri]
MYTDPGNSLAPRLALEPRSWPVYWPWQQFGTQASPGAEELACILALATKESKVRACSARGQYVNCGAFPDLERVTTAIVCQQCLLAQGFCPTPGGTRLPIAPCVPQIAGNFQPHKAEGFLETPECFSGRLPKPDRGYGVTAYHPAASRSLVEAMVCLPTLQPPPEACRLPKPGRGYGVPAYPPAASRSLVEATTRRRPRV